MMPLLQYKRGRFIGVGSALVIQMIYHSNALRSESARERGEYTLPTTKALPSDKQHRQ